MDSSSSSLSNRPGTYVGAYFAVWASLLILLRTFERFDAGEAIAALVILGVIFPALALLVTHRVPALPTVIRKPGTETLVLVMYLAAIAWILVSGFGLVARIGAEPLHSVVLSAKVLTFVAVPAAIISALGRYQIAELIPASLGWRGLRPALWMSLAAVLMQSFLGRGLHDIRGAHLPLWVLVVAAPLSFVWLAVEVGIVEEFFFRVLLQERLAVALRSPWGGLVVATVLFGLVHAPGFFLRPAATQEGLGSHPSLLMAVGYSIVLTSLGGLFLGVLWMRTKNFAVLVIVHAAGDLLPNLVPWVKAFHLTR
jgi:membrane protease YdiL (CAAX protease family)